MMTTFFLILCGLLGATLQVFAKMQSMKDLFEKSNEKFLYRKFLEDEMIYIGSSIASIVLFVLIRTEFFSFRPDLVNYERIISAFVGALGAWIWSKAVGKTQKYIKSVIDEKTNIADGKN